MYTLISFLVDLYLGYPDFLVLIIAIELPILAVIYAAIKGYKWAYFTTFMYYFIRSLNFYFPEFYWMTKNGLNLEISFNSVGINIISMLFFFLLFYDLKSRFNSKVISRLRILSFLLLSTIFIAGIITPTDDKYVDQYKNQELTIELDTTSTYQSHYGIDIPENWESATDYQGLSLVAISPFEDELDSFRENFNIQAYTLNIEDYSSELVGNRIFESGTSDIGFDVQIINTEITQDFYIVEYLMSDSTNSFQSIMYCQVKGNKAYTLIFSDSEESFKSNLESTFESIKNSFSIY